MKRGKKTLLVLAAIAAAGFVYYMNCPACRRKKTPPVTLSNGRTYSVDAAYNQAGY